MLSAYSMSLQNSPINDNPTPLNDSNDAPQNANANPRNTEQRGKEISSNNHAVPKLSPSHNAHILHQTQLLNKTLFSQFTPFFRWNYIITNKSNNGSQPQRHSPATPMFPAITGAGGNTPLSEEAIRLAAAALLNSPLAADPSFLYRTGQFMDATASQSPTSNKPINNEQNLPEQPGPLLGDQLSVNEVQYDPNPQVSQFVQDFIDLILPDFAADVIEDTVREQFHMIATPYSNDFHQKRAAGTATSHQSNKIPNKRSSTRRKVEKAPVELDNELTDISEEEQEEAIDPLRKHLLRDWKEEVSQYDWRFEWLYLRTKQLQFERDEVDLELQTLRQRQYEPDHSNSLHRPEQSKLRPSNHKKVTQDTSVFKRKILTARTYPPEKRREDILNHPAFSPFHRPKNVGPLVGLTREDIVTSLNIFQNPEPKRNSSQTKRPRGLSVDIPIPNEQLPKRTKKSASSSAGTPSRLNKRGLSSSSAKKSKARDFDFQEFYVPWSDVRSNIVIEEVKPKEIFTPSWRSVDFLNGFDFGNDDDESDEFYIALHLPLEVEERRKTWLYMEGGNEKRKKKKKDMNPALQTSIQPDVNITSIFVQHSDIVLPNTPQQQPTTPNSGKESLLSLTNISTTPNSAKNEKVPRYLQISKESYVSHSFPYPNSILGNWEELKTKHEEIERERKRLIEEQTLIKTNIMGSGHKAGIEEKFVDDYLATDSLVVSDDEFDLEGWRSGDDDYEFHDNSSPDSEDSEPSDFDAYSPNAKRQRRDRSKRKPKENFVFEVLERTGPLSLTVRRVPK